MKRLLLSLLAVGLIYGLPPARIKISKREKYPAVFIEPEVTDIYKVCLGSEKTKPYEYFACRGESARRFHDPEYNPGSDASHVNKYGRFECERDTCQYIVDGEMQDLIFKYIGKKLDPWMLEAIQKSYPYLSDLNKEVVFNAAVQYNQIEIVRSFIEQGIDVNAGVDSLWKSTFEVNYSEPAEGMSEEIKKNTSRVLEGTPIYWARRSGYKEIIKLLENSGRLHE